MNKTPIEGKFDRLVTKYEQTLFFLELKRHGAYMKFKKDVKQLLSDVASAGSLRRQAGPEPSKRSRRVKTAPKGTKPVKTEVDHSAFSRVSADDLVAWVEGNGPATIEDIRLGYKLEWTMADIKHVLENLPGIILKKRLDDPENPHYWVNSKVYDHFELPDAEELAAHLYQNTKIRTLARITKYMRQVSKDKNLQEYSELEIWTCLVSNPALFKLVDNKWFRNLDQPK